LNKDLSSLPLMKRPEPDPLLDAPRYEVQRITDGKQYGAHVEFRVTDKRTDSRIATCYVQENAEFIVAALNALPSKRATIVLDAPPVATHAYAAPQEEHTEAKGIPDAAGHHPAAAAFSIDKEHQCCMGGPLRVEPCASCPEHPIQQFRAWLDAYGHKTGYDRGDMAACWYAGKRSALSASGVTCPSVEEERARLKAIEHAAWHALEASEEREDCIIVPLEEAQALSTLLSDAHPDSDDQTSDIREKSRGRS